MINRLEDELRKTEEAKQQTKEKAENSFEGWKSEALKKMQYEHSPITTIKKIFGWPICALAHAFLFPGKFSNITFWKSSNRKYLYCLMSETHITDEEKFLKVFPMAIRITEIEFDLLLFFYPERKFVTVADDRIIDELKEEEPTSQADEGKN